MTYIAPDTETHRIIRGVDTSITHRVYLEADETVPTITAASCEAQVYDHAGSAVGSALSVSWNAGTATLSATVPGTDTGGEDLGNGWWSVVWTVDGAEGAQDHQRRARLIRRLAPPTLLSEELNDRYPELGNIRTTAELREGIAEAYEDLQRDLAARGVLIDQITDPAWRHRAHYLRAAAHEYGKAARDQQDDAFSATRDELMQAYHGALDDGIPYDGDEDGDEDTHQEHATDDRWFWRSGRLS